MTTLVPRFVRFVCGALFLLLPSLVPATTLQVDGPTASEGLRPSDVIRQCKGVRLDGWNDFKRDLALRKGDQVALVVRRNQRDLELDVLLPSR